MQRFMSTCSICVGSARTADKSSARDRLDLDVLANHLVEQIQYVVDRLIEAEVSRLQNLPPGKGQQLPDQRRDAVALRMNFLEIIFQSRVAGSGLLFSQFRPAENGADHVVEIVRDPSGQLADGLEFLRVLQLLFESPALGHVP